MTFTRSTTRATMRRLLGASALALALTAASVEAHAADTATQIAQAARSFSIPAQPLSGALAAFGQQAGLQVTVDSGLVAGVQSPGVTGTLSPDDALRQLLSGTGITWRFADARTVTFERMRGAGGTVRLNPLTVESGAARETAWGPVAGFVASRSASGTKTDTPLIETPQTIDVVTRDQMDARQAQSVPQALRYTSGVVSEQRGNMTKLDFIYSRGFAIDQYQDGLRLLGGPWGVSQIEPYSLERVEVVKGPASILYGQASPGGVINLVTKRPTTEPLHDIQVGIGSFDRYQGAVDVGGAMDKDGQFSYRITGLARQAETQSDFSRDDRVFVAPAVTWRPNAMTSLTLLTSYQLDEGGGFYNFVPAYGTALPNANGTISRKFNPGEPNFDSYTRRGYSAGYLFEHGFDDVWTVRQNLRFIHLDTKFHQIFANVLQADRRTLTRYSWNNEEELDSVTLDNQVQAKFATGALTHTVLFGLDYQRREYEQLLGSNFAGPPAIDLFNPRYGLTIPVPAFTQDNVSIVDQTGVYLQDQVKFDRFVLLFGGRQDYAGVEAKNGFSGVTTSTQSPDAFTGRAGLLYLFPNGLAPYISYAESFQPTAGSDFNGVAFKPTTGQQVEAGLKFQPTGFNSFAQISVFDLTQQNVTTTDPAHPTFSIQTGEVNAKGTELSALASLAEGFNVSAAYSFLDNIITKSNSTNLGKHPVGIPKHKASLWTDYNFGTGVAAGLTIGGGVRYIGSTFGDSTNSFKVASVTLADAAISYDLGVLGPQLQGAKVNLTASNIFDKEYVAYCGTVNSCAYGTGRTVLATMRYQW